MTSEMLTLSQALDRLRTAPYDEASWRTLYKELWPYVVSVATRALGARTEAASDIAQEVFMALLRVGPAADFSSDDALRAYLRVVTVNQVRTYFRRLRNEELGDHVDASVADVIESRMTDDELRRSETLKTVLSSLTESERMVVEFLVRGYSLREVAEALGVTYSAAGVRLHRLRKKLAKLLDDKDLERVKPA